MDPAISSALLVYGPLGLFALVACLVAVRLYRDREKERGEHRAEMKVMEDRLIAKSESWMEKYHELAKSMNALLESMAKRYAEQQQLRDDLRRDRDRDTQRGGHQ